ncbi:MAG TPA: cyclic nucleotide-binding domain-containing protein [Chthoniobacterales bacterium]|nr:cyclic nucleotide-binding domain-containing protein [Chthoniobacterales bacterium]
MEITQDHLVHRCLGASRLCEGLPADVIEVLAREATVFEMEQDAVLFEDNDVTHAIHIVAEGEIGFLIRTTPNAEFSEIARIGKGEFFGEGAAIDDLATQEQISGSAGFSRRPARSARIVCRQKATIVQLPAREFGKLLREYPVLLCRNLLRSSSDKLRMGVQRTFDDVLERENRLILARITRWLTRRLEDPVSTLQLQSGLLQESETESTQAFAPYISEASSELTGTLQMLAELAGGSQRKIVWENFSLRSWWNETEPEALARISARNITLQSYLEDFSLESSRSLLRMAVVQFVTGTALLCPIGGTLELKAGRHHGHAEIHLQALMPGLSDSTARRLFEPFAVQTVSPDATVALALAQRTARMLGGDASVKRRNGERVTLVITLPTYRRDATAPL